MVTPDLITDKEVHGESVDSGIDGAL